MKYGLEYEGAVMNVAAGKRDAMVNVLLAGETEGLADGAPISREQTRTRMWDARSFMKKLLIN